MSNVKKKGLKDRKNGK